MYEIRSEQFTERMIFRCALLSGPFRARGLPVISFLLLSGFWAMTECMPVCLLSLFFASLSQKKKKKNSPHFFVRCDTPRFGGYKYSACVHTITLHQAHNSLKKIYLNITFHSQSVPKTNRKFVHCECRNSTSCEQTTASMAFLVRFIF